MAEHTKNALFAVLGRPNVGKSTLMNALVGEKIAAVSPKPQTTRTRILGVVNTGEYQLVFADTPGLHRPRTKLGEAMVQHTQDSIAGIDAAILVTEPFGEIAAAEITLIERLKASKIPCIIVINKIDRVSPAKVLPVIEEISKLGEFAAIIPVSALKRSGLDELVEQLKKFAVISPALFPEDMLTDQSDISVISEIIREKLLICLDSEVPHGIAVEIEKFSERGSEEDPVIDVSAVIYCEKQSHKSIIIGKNGSMLKKTGTLARAEIEKYMGSHVNLQTWVKVRENWRDNPGAISNFGIS